MSSPEVAGLTRVVAQMQRELRDLAIGNPLNAGAVQNAAGRYVALPAMAFGQVAAREAGQVTLSVNSAAWISGAPVLDVVVQGGKLRVDVAARLVVAGYNLRIGMSYGVTGPSAAADGGGSMVQAPDESRALLLKNQQGGFAEASFGFPDLVEDLEAGWYRVQAYYQLLGEANDPADTTGNATNRRLFGTPF